MADAIVKAPIRRTAQTSISAAIDFAMEVFNKSPYRSARRVIDISGDGPNNHGGSSLLRAIARSPETSPSMACPLLRDKRHRKRMSRI